MNISIIGSRSFDNYELLRYTILDYFKGEIKNLIIVSGGAKGADKLGEKFAEEFNLETKIFLPDWDTFGNRAGMIRNEDIIKNSEVVFAFWDQVSHGTKHGIDLSQKNNKKLILTTFKALSFKEKLKKIIKNA